MSHPALLGLLVRFHDLLLMHVMAPGFLGGVLVASFGFHQFVHLVASEPPWMVSELAEHATGFQAGDVGLEADQSVESPSGGVDSIELGNIAMQRKAVSC